MTLAARRRNGIFAVAAPGVAARDAAQAQPGTVQHAVALDSLKKVLGAGGMKPAAGARSADEVERR